MTWRTRGYPSAIPALSCFAFASLLGMVMFVSPLEAGMESAVFALHYKPKFEPYGKIPYLCDNPATPDEERNYSPNYTDTRCDAYWVSGLPLGPGQVYVVVARAGSEGVGAVSFGVTYTGSSGQGIDPAHVTWTPCADGLSFPTSDGVHGDFPQPGGGLRITWNLPASCQFEEIYYYGVHAVVGVFYVYAYSDDLLRLTPNYNVTGGPEAAISNCSGITTDLVDLWGVSCTEALLMGRAAFGTQGGFNPCQHGDPPPGSDPLPCLTTPTIPTTWGQIKTRYRGNP